MPLCIDAPTLLQGVILYVTDRAYVLGQFFAPVLGLSLIMRASPDKPCFDLSQKVLVLFFILYSAATVREVLPMSHALEAGKVVHRGSSVF